MIRENKFPRKNSDWLNRENKFPRKISELLNRENKFGNPNINSVARKFYRSGPTKRLGEAGGNALSTYSLVKNGCLRGGGDEGSLMGP